MKFVCNNCGFSAEVPDRKTTCPMCASDNVSVVTVTEQVSIEPEESSTEEQVKSDPGVEPESAAGKEQFEKKKRGPTERITLNDEFFSAKPNKDDQEIANIIKELYPESGEKKKSLIKLPEKKIMIIAAVVAVCVVVATILAFSLTGAKKGEESDLAAEEEEEEILEEGDIKPIHAQAVVKKENDEPIDEKETSPVVNKQEPKTVVVEKIEKKQKPKQEKPLQKIKEAKPPVNVAATFESYIQAGHKAIAAQKYKDALHEYKNASRLMPTNGSVYKFLGIAYASLKNQKEACANYRKYIKYAPNAPDKAQVEALLKDCQ